MNLLKDQANPALDQLETDRERWEDGRCDVLNHLANEACCIEQEIWELKRNRIAPWEIDAAARKLKKLVKKLAKAEKAERKHAALTYEKDTGLDHKLIFAVQVLLDAGVQVTADVVASVASQVYFDIKADVAIDIICECDRFVFDAGCVIFAAKKEGQANA